MSMFVGWRLMVGICGPPMRDAIDALYHDDPISDRQHAAVTLTAPPAPNTEPSDWLADEAVGLDELEHRIALRTR